MNHLNLWFRSLSAPVKVIVGVVTAIVSFTCVGCASLLFIATLIGPPQRHTTTSINSPVTTTPEPEVVVSNEPTPTLQSTNSPTPSANPTVQVAEVTDEFQSGGLGLSRAAWEQRHGQPIQDSAGFLTYRDQLTVAYRNDLAWYVERSLGNEGIPISQAQELSRLLIPHDSQLADTYQSTSGSNVQLLISETLKSRFPEEKWTNGEPGNFTVLHNIINDKVHRIVIALGNNP